MMTEKSNIPTRRNWRSWLIYFFGFLLFIPFAFLLLLQNSNFQQTISRKVATHFAHRTGFIIDFEKVHYTFFHKLLIKKLVIADSLHDTLLYAPELVVDLQAVFFSHRQLVFNHIQLNQAKISLKKDSAGRLNWEQLINFFSTADTLTTASAPGWQYKFRNVSIENANICIDGILDSTQWMAWQGNRFSGVVLRIKNLLLGKNTIEGRINRLGFTTPTGFTLINLSADVTYKKNETFQMSKFSMVTPSSNIDIKLLSFDLSESLPFVQLPMIGVLNLSKINLNEIGYFLPQWKGRNMSVKMSGEAKGNMNDLRIKNLILFTSEDNFFKGNIHYTRIPDMSEPYLYLDVKEIRATCTEVQQILSIFTADSVQLPEVINRLQRFNFKGNFTGFPSDFVAFGTLQSPVGILKLDIALKPSSNKNIAYNGSLETFQLEIGKLIGQNELIGPTHLTLSAQGNLIKGKDISGNIALDIQSTSINGYPLHNLGARGTIENSVFQGKATINDPNLQIETSGRYSLLDSFPSFNFSAQIKKVNLFSFHILPRDSIQHLQATVEAQFTGNSMNEFDGNINVSNLVMTNMRSTLKIKDIEVQAFNNERVQATVISSDFFNMQVNGKYRIGALAEGFKAFLKKYIPSFKTDNHNVDGNDFTFTVLLKHSQPILDFFYPVIKIADSTTLSGTFNPLAGKLDLNATADYFQFKTMLFEQPIFKINSDGSTLSVTLSATSLRAGGQMPFARLSTSFNLINQNAQLYVAWYDSLAHINEIRLKAESIGFENNLLIANFTIEPSRIFIRGEPWSLAATSFVLDTVALSINHFRLNHQGSEITINGQISKRPSDSLQLSFQNLDLNLLNYLLQSQNFHFTGTIDGRIAINDFYRHRNMVGNLSVRSLAINQADIGNIGISARWDPDNEAVKVQLASTDTLVRLKATGNFYPLRRSYLLDAYFNEISLKIIEPLVSSTFRVDRGNFAGHIHLSDEASKPVLNGNIEIKDARLQLIPLQASYTFSHTLLIDHNTFQFRNFTLYDEAQHPLRLNGQLRNKYLKDFSLDFTLLAENNLVLNKSAPDDLPFYGKAFASGKIHIYSNGDFITVDVTEGKTEENSTVLVALGQTYYSGKNDFIQFVSPMENKKETSTNENLSLISQKRSKLLLNMDLDVTPQAEIQLLLSAQYGDLLRGRGTGNLKFEIDRAGNFYIRGQYAFTEGMYNFTMNNLMNKKFEIQSNSTIYFNGRPTDANVDITAVYHTRAPLYNLFAESNLEYRKRIPVDCQLFLTGRLMEPNIRLSIDLPNATEETKSRVRSIINSEQEMSQQFLALLLLNNFMPATTGTLQTKLQESNLGVDVATTTSMELLSSQLSSWISSLNKDFDIGVSYRPGDQVYSNEDLEIALSTQLLNNRMTINSSIDIIGQSTTNTAARQSSTLLGDVNVEYRLTDRLSLKAFNRPNDILYFQDDIYTRGVGIIYREEFSNLKELTQRYFKQKQNKTDTLTAKQSLKNHK